MNTKLKEKSILIVGANGALAKETIKHLLNDGYKNIIMACRTEEKGISAKKEILSAINDSTNANLTVVGGFDMNNPLKIENAVKSLPSNNPFDIIFLAAGFAVFTDDYQSVEWNGKKVEKNIFQNLIGSHLTLSNLKKNNLIMKGARVVLAGGEGARGIKGIIDSPNFTSSNELRDYIYLKQKPKYNPMNAIGVSKLCGAFWTTKISELESENMEVIWFSPGLTSGSDGLKTLPTAKRFMMSIIFGIMGILGKSQTPQQGAKKNADCLEGKIGKNGDLLGAPKGKTIGKITDQTSMNPNFSDTKLINKFWTVLEELCGDFETIK